MLLCLIHYLPISNSPKILHSYPSPLPFWFKAVLPKLTSHHQMYLLSFSKNNSISVKQFPLLVLEIYTAFEKLLAPLLQTGVHLKLFHFSLLKYSVRWEALPEPKLLYLPSQSHEITLNMLEVMPRGIISAHKDEEKRSMINSVNLPVTSQISDQHKCQDEITR